MSKHLKSVKGLAQIVELFIALVTDPMTGEYLDRKHFSHREVSRRFSVLFKNTPYKGMFTKHKMGHASDRVKAQRQYQRDCDASWAAHWAAQAAQEQAAQEQDAQPPTFEDVSTALMEETPYQPAVEPAAEPSLDVLMRAYLDKTDPEWRAKAAGYLSLPKK